MRILNSCIHVHKQFTNDSSKSITETELNFWKSGHPAAWDGHHAPSFTTQRMTISLIVISVFLHFMMPSRYSKHQVGSAQNPLTWIGHPVTLPWFISHIRRQPGWFPTMKLIIVPTFPGSTGRFGTVFCCSKGPRPTSAPLRAPSRRGPVTMARGKRMSRQTTSPIEDHIEPLLSGCRGFQNGG